MEMTPNLIPNADWIPCAHGLPEANKFVWVLVGKIVQAGLARRYQKEVHMAVWDGDAQRFKIYPYRLPILSNQIWAWAQMVPPAAPITRSTEAVHQQEHMEGEGWKDDSDSDDSDDSDERYKGSEFDDDL